MNITINDLLDRQALPQPVTQRAVWYAKFTRPLFDTQGAAIMRKCFGCACLRRHRWFSQCLLYGPIVQPHSQRAVSDSDTLSPVKQTERFSVVRQHSRLAAILRLFFFTCPATILRGVWTVGVGISINRCLRIRLWSHVIEKTLERILPSLANGDSTTTVKVIVGGVGIAASGFHCAPNAVLRCASFPFCWQLDRIIRRHSSTPLQLDCDIEPSMVNHNQFGSFHFSVT